MDNPWPAFLGFSVLAIFLSVRVEERMRDKKEPWDLALFAALGEVIFGAVRLVGEFLSGLFSATEETISEHPAASRSVFEVALALGGLLLAVWFGFSIIQHMIHTWKPC